MEKPQTKKPVRRLGRESQPHIKAVIPAEAGIPSEYESTKIISLINKSVFRV